LIVFHRFRRTRRLDPAASKKPLSPLIGGVKYASLSGRYAIFAVGELDRGP
jgi:hypothetical protein